MFTGIVDGLGEVVGRRGSRLVVAAPAGSFRLGESLAVNGVCLTVAEFDVARPRIRKSSRPSRKSPLSTLDSRLLCFDVSPETFARTNLGKLEPGSPVNLERPLTAQTPIGGHWVTGHVDAVVRLLEKEALKDGFVRLRFSLPKELARFVALKGSVALDGVSLTITRVGKGYGETVLVPYTLVKTTLGGKVPGDPLNLEVDLLARYLHRMMEEP